MTGRELGDGDGPDLSVLVRDELLIDSLGRGEPAPAGDGLATLLAAWRADIVTPGTGTVASPAGNGGHASAVQTSDGPAETVRSGDAIVAEASPVTPLRPPRRQRRPPRAAVAAAVGALVLATGLGVGSWRAGPTDPLWSLTKALYPHQAEIRQVEHVLDQARAALASGQVDEARRFIAVARGQLAGINDPTAVARLRADLDALNADLPTDAATPTPARTPNGATTAPAPAVSITVRPGDPAALPTPTMSPRPEDSASEARPPLVPLAPTLSPAPDLPTPLPSLSGLPLPTGLLPL